MQPTALHTAKNLHSAVHSLDNLNSQSWPESRQSWSHPISCTRCVQPLQICITYKQSKKA